MKLSSLEDYIPAKLLKWQLTATELWLYLIAHWTLAFYTFLLFGGVKLYKAAVSNISVYTKRQKKNTDKIWNITEETTETKQ